MFSNSTGRRRPGLLLRGLRALLWLLPGLGLRGRLRGDPRLDG